MGKLLTVTEVAERFRVTEETIRRLLRSGRLQGIRPGGTKAGWRIDEEKVERFLAEARPGRQTPNDTQP